MNRFKKDNRGMVWVIIVIVFGLIVYSLLWFSLGFALFEVADTVESNYTFPEPMASAVDFVRTLIQYNPIIVAFGMLLWGYINTQRRTN